MGTGPITVNLRDQQPWSRSRDRLWNTRQEVHRTSLVVSIGVGSKEHGQGASTWGPRNCEGEGGGGDSLLFPGFWFSLLEALRKGGITLASPPALNWVPRQYCVPEAKRSRQSQWEQWDRPMQRGRCEGVASDGSRKTAKGPRVLREGSRESDQLLACWSQAVRLKGVLAGPICRCPFLAHPSVLLLLQGSGPSANGMG